MPCNHAASHHPVFRTLGEKRVDHRVEARQRGVVLVRAPREIQLGRLLRSSSAMPSTCSSSWICRLSGGCVANSRCAARPKCSSSATATK
ncbi:hypothetical protein WL41_23030 [Burkholderia ubonensis]|nr:hypothetical protein WL41_23030 [Burkholderia ubonensis]